jgi:putative hydrolase of the HAD superfamily
VVVFDLDDTLYLERDYVASGFRAAGSWFHDKTNCAGLAEACFSLFEDGHRGHAFDRALERLGIPPNPDLVRDLVEVYRTHRPALALAPDAARWLRRPDLPATALITDGLLQVQLAKIEALGLPGLLDHIVCTGAWGRPFWKPHERAFEAVESWSGLSGRDLVYVADNPAKDFVTPRARGWATVQIARPERVHRLDVPSPEYRPHAVIDSLDGLDDCLAVL